MEATATISQAFRQIIEEEEEVFDEMMFDISRFYISACSYMLFNL
jgi:hypothetical protein